MQQREGLFIVIEGIDGSGKGTQFKRLAKRLEAAGYDVATFDFPRYDEPSSYFIKRYLNGMYGNTADEVSPYTASLFFALDRFEAAPQIQAALDAGKIVLANRFTGSNMAAQGTKFRNAEERRGYFIWLDNLEFEMLQIPRPNFNVVLRVPAEIAQEYIDKKAKRDYTDKKRDLHEADLDHLRRQVDVYDDLCQLFSRDFLRIDCTRDDHMLPKDAVENLLWEKIAPFLPKPPNRPKVAKATAPKAPSLRIENPYVEFSDGPRITKAGHDYVSKLVTDPDGPVYALTDAVRPLLAATAIAHMSRRRDDVRTNLLTILPTLSAEQDQVTSTLTIEPSAGRLTGTFVVIEGISSLSVQALERVRQIIYCERPLRYSLAHHKSQEDAPRYFMPDSLDDKTGQQYRNCMDKIFRHYDTLVTELTHYVRNPTSTIPKSEQTAVWKRTTRQQAQDVAQLVLPLATQTTVALYASWEMLGSLVLRLEGDELPEARRTGERLRVQLRLLNPAFLDHIDLHSTPAYRAATLAGIKKLVAQYLSAKHSDGVEQSTELVNVWPRNELDIVPELLFAQSDLPLHSLQAIVASWPYDKKVAVLETYLRERPHQYRQSGCPFEKVQYEWDLVIEYHTFRELQRQQLVANLDRQVFTPRYGFAVPKLVDDAGLTETFEACFALSLELHSILQAAGYNLESEYAALFGHKLRWKMGYNACEAFGLHDPQAQVDPSVRQLFDNLQEKLVETHPLLANAFSSVAMPPIDETMQL